MDGTASLPGMRRIEDIAKGEFRRGVVTGMDRDEYRAACGLNPSSIKQPSPKHVKYAYENQGETTDAMRLGTAVHTLVWEPEKFAAEVVTFKGTRTTRDGAPTGKWAECVEANEGKLILKPDAYERTVAIATAVCSEPLVQELAREGLAETAVFTVENNLQCRGLMDWISTDTRTLCDLKVVNSIDDRMFGNAVQRYGWDVSMSLYRRWFQNESGKAIDFVKFIAVESKPPFDVVVVPVDQAVLDAAWIKASAMIAQVQFAIQSGWWPGIARGKEVPLYVPAYVMREDEMVGFEEAA